MTIGIALSVKSNLGVSPVSSIPYTMTCVWGIEMGKATISYWFWSRSSYCEKASSNYVITDPPCRRKKWFLTGISRAKWPANGRPTFCKRICSDPRTFPEGFLHHRRPFGKLHIKWYADSLPCFHQCRSGCQDCHTFDCKYHKSTSFIITKFLLF